MPFVNKQQIPTPSGDERRRTRDCESLLEQLTDLNPTARRWAARDLAGCPESAMALVAQLLVETERSVRAVILSTLTQLKTSCAITGLVDCLRSEDAALRNDAIEALAQCPHEVEGLMQPLLSDADPDVRIFAISIVESLCIPTVESLLIGVITNDTHVNVCAAAVGVLAEIGTGVSIAPLEALAQRFQQEPFLSFAIGLALKRIDKDVQ